MLFLTLKQQCQSTEYISRERIKGVAVDHFSGPCRAIGLMCVCVCVSSCAETIAFERNVFDLDIRHAGSPSTKVSVTGQSSRWSQEENVGEVIGDMHFTVSRRMEGSVDRGTE